ncbi:MAG: hypothetical protein GF383_02680 [Candidatus Lokiarchaeota archaeon]|nr:hypothetical protein [Candidatus Lokiarchaeota archaeon]MBD3338338.1 hypothetical protein [Candidatus Lokiarchaeota archaeon]
MIKGESSEPPKNVIFTQTLVSIESVPAINREICNCSEIEHYFKSTDACDKVSSYVSKFLSCFKIPQKRVNKINADDFLFILNMIRKSFKHCYHSLTHQKKFQICALERHLMKLYLVAYMKQYNLD